jgi:hypothetical protein
MEAPCVLATVFFLCRDLAMDEIGRKPDRRPWRFGTHASVIQLLTLLCMPCTVACADIYGAAFTLACFLFWTWAALLLWWHEHPAWRLERFFLRWGLLAFALIGTPLLEPVAALGADGWRQGLVCLGLPLLFVAPLMYLVTCIIELRAPSDGMPPASEA